MDQYTLERLDKGIKDAVMLLSKYGFDTFESCEGGKGHCFSDPTVRFNGNEFDLIRAYNLCELHNLNVFSAKRVFQKDPIYSNVNDGEEIGECWVEPFNEIVFMVHEVTGTIYNDTQD